MPILLAKVSDKPPILEPHRKSPLAILLLGFDTNPRLWYVSKVLPEPWIGLTFQYFWNTPLLRPETLTSLRNHISKPGLRPNRRHFAWNIADDPKVPSRTSIKDIQKQIAFIREHQDPLSAPYEIAILPSRSTLTVRDKADYPGANYYLDQEQWVRAPRYDRPPT